MANQQSHRMDLERTYSDGDEIWHCPICGKRMMIRWEPFQKTILEHGDENAGHSGSKGGLQIGPVKILQPEMPNLEPSDIWINGLDGIDLDGL